MTLMYIKIGENSQNRINTCVIEDTRSILNRTMSEVRKIPSVGAENTATAVATRSTKMMNSARAKYLILKCLSSTSTVVSFDDIFIDFYHPSILQEKRK